MAFGLSTGIGRQRILIPAPEPDGRGNSGAATGAFYEVRAYDKPLGSRLVVEFRRTLGGGVHHKPDGLQPACDVPKSMPVDGERKPGSMCVRAVRRPTIARVESEQATGVRQVRELASVRRRLHRDAW